MKMTITCRSSILSLFFIIIALSSSLPSFLFSEAAQPLILKGNKYFNKSEYEEAGRCFQEALAGQPDNLPALTGLASSLYQLERYEETARELKRAIQSSPRNISLYLWLIDTISALENNSGPVEEFRREYRPQLLSLWFEQDFNRTISDYREILEKYPDSAWANYIIGFTYLKLGRPEKARLFYEKASRLAPGWASPGPG